MRRLIIAIMLMSVALAACESEAEKEREKQNASKPCTTTPTPVGSLPGLGSFPGVSEVSYTGTTQAGPSTVVTGFSAKDLDEVYESYKNALSQGGYSVTKSEKEEADAEVNFSGNNTTGQVKLAIECAGRTSVGITIRPSQ